MSELSPHGLLGLEPLVQLGSVVAVHVDLGEHREIDVVVVGDEGTDFFGGAGLLPELVAREAEDADPVVVMMKRTQTCVLRRDTSSGGDVDDETGLIGEVREGHLLTLKRRHGEVVESAHGGQGYPAHGAVSGVTPWCVWPTSAPLPRRLGTGRSILGTKDFGCEPQPFEPTDSTGFRVVDVLPTTMQHVVVVHELHVACFERHLDPMVGIVDQRRVGLHRCLLRGGEPGRRLVALRRQNELRDVANEQTPALPTERRHAVVGLAVRSLLPRKS